MIEHQLSDLFLEKLMNAYYSEQLAVHLISRLVSEAQNAALRTALEHRVIETHVAIDRLDQVFALAERPVGGIPCRAFEGIAHETDCVLQEYKGTKANDCGLVSSTQIVQHYDLARYGTLSSWARALGMDAAAGLLNRTLWDVTRSHRSFAVLSQSIDLASLQDH